MRNRTAANWDDGFASKTPRISRAGMLATFAPRSRTLRRVRFLGSTAKYTGQQFLERRFWSGITPA